MMFEEHYDASVEFAKKRFLENGELIQSVLLGWEQKGGVTAIIQFDDFSDEIREGMRNIFNATIQKIHEEEGLEGPPDFYIQIAETWMISANKDEINIPKKGMPGIDIRSSEHPDRKEALVIQGGHHDGRNRMWISEIFREPNLHLGKPDTEKDLTEQRSRVAILLWDDSFEKTLGEAIEEVGEDPSEELCLKIAIGWINATMKSSLGEQVPPNIRAALLRAANLIKENANL